MTSSVESPAKRPVARVVSAAVGLVLVALIVLFAFAKPGGGDVAQSPLLGKPAPVVKSTTIDGPDFELARRKGSWVVINFFNSTCVPCRQEHPLLVQFVKDQAKSANPAELYTVVNDDSDGAVKAFFATNGGDWPVVRDDDGAISVAFGVAKVPETWIIDPDGFVRVRIAGALTAGFLTERLNELKSQYTGEASS